ncbi:MAG: PRC-barrel domain-containing protein [Candidatus Nanoarchaeia archaeon]|jgi:sporulation protein YlmC with PRC-barrel domain
MADERIISRNIIGKTVVSKTGKTFGKVGDVVFETRTGELIYILLDSPTSYTSTFELEANKDGIIQIPFSSVIAVGDFVVIQEEDLG